MQREGSGWRLAIDPSRDGFQALIGGEGWALELSLQEFQQLRSLVAKLLEQHEAIADQLMAEEQIEICLEEGSWWLELRGDFQHWSLRFVLSGGVARGAEAGWPVPASAEMALALAQADSF